MQLLGSPLLAFLTIQGSVQALQTAITCTTTADCAWGETCVAGDSNTVTQACVASTVCGGSSMGNCPSDDNGKLACLWRPHSDCSGGCAVLHGNKGIYKCVSLSRCDAYYGGASCSGGCSVNGVQCNGRGSCNMMSFNSDETPNFSCTCETGHGGEKCEVTAHSTKAHSTKAHSTKAHSTKAHSTKAHSTKAHSTKAPSTNSSSTNNSDSAWKILDDDPDIDPNEDTSTEASSMDNVNGSSSGNGQDYDASSVNGSPSSGSPKAASSNSMTSSSRGGIRTGLLIFVLVMTAIVMLGTILLVWYFSRKKKQQEEEEKEYASALASAQGVGAVGLLDIAAGHTGHTPRARIITM